MNIGKAPWLRNMAVILAWVLVLACLSAHAADQSICNPGVSVVVHNNGSVKSCQLKYDYDANAVRCKSDYPISFYTNGSLESCVLSAAATITGYKCMGSGEISFYMNGNLRSCIKPNY